MKTKILDNGQVTIPAPYRKKLKLSPGDAVEIVLENGFLKILPGRPGRLMDLAGCIKADRPFPDKEDIRAAVADAAVKRHARSQREAD